MAEVNVDTAQFAVITDRVAATETKISALLKYMEQACRDAGLPSPADAGAPVRRRPRHARPRGHLRLVPAVTEADHIETTGDEP